MNKFEKNSEFERSIEVPRDLFDFDYSVFEEDHIPEIDERAKQIALKILKFLKQFNAGDKKKALEAIEKDFDINSPVSDYDEATTLHRLIFKELFLLKL